MEELFTKRLHLRPLVMADAAEMFEISKTPNVGPNAGWKPHESLAETKKIMKAVFVEKPGVFAIVRRENGRLIGDMGLVEDDRRENVPARMLGYAFGEEYWGQGFATEAALAVVQYGFEKMGLPLISAYCYPHNTSSRRVLEKCGFQHEGRLRQAEMLWNGQVRDVECFSLTPDEFACAKRAK